MTNDTETASRLVADGTPVVLIGPDARVLGAVVANAADNRGHRRLLAVMVGDPTDPAVVSAAEEMAGELWPGAGRGSRCDDGSTVSAGADH